MTGGRGMHRGCGQGVGGVEGKEKNEPLPKGFSILIFRREPAGQSGGADIWRRVFISPLFSAAVNTTCGTLQPLN